MADGARPAIEVAMQRFNVDFSLALINRTGAYYVGRDLVQSLPHLFDRIRYWRFHFRREPGGVVRKLLGRAMLLELQRRARAGLPQRQEVADDRRAATLYLDPLYVLFGNLQARDIVLCHDVGPITHPELFDAGTREMYRAAYRIIERAAPGMVFVSAASRSEFVKCFGQSYRFLRVIPLYVRPGLLDGPAIKPPSIEPPFILTVGGLETRKNHARVIEAFAGSGLRERGFSYVVCGPRGNSADLVEGLARATPGVHVLGYLSDANVRWLYRHATAFVLPSLLEGFGLPALEAGQGGLVSVISHSEAQREAVGEAALMVDPLSTTAIAEGMRKAVDMTPAERAHRVELAREQARTFSIQRYLTAWSDLLEAPAA
jgi:glycosyltransferase involved in cell wall biosynthesis